ncbi:MAG: hypothetical protein IPN08_16235 [Bacteroidales bacterium]|nr:hypothetical protein [Bacteroidales bacterium]MBK9358902.1 hypothetical protein [Bacteroidales bacterium]
MENYQEISVYIILAGTFLIAGYKLYKKLTSPVKGCNGCESDCSGCKLQDLKKEIEENKGKKTG